MGIQTAIYGFLYAGLTADGRVKIGISSDPERRRRQIETAGGVPIVAWESFTVYAPAACERYVHNRWAAHRGLGEFFSGGRELFDEVVEYMRPRQSRCDLPTLSRAPVAHLYADLAA